ncbi:MAG: hypothetical protein LBK60_02450 [Verrucomicrobiales bacterium]|jgi:hypothetical protein|nr:hypothetical protein [Verrucomicrobiales bacterium]
MHTLAQILDLHRGATSKRRFLREVYNIDENLFYQAVRGDRTMPRTLLLAIKRYHIDHFPQLPLTLRLKYAGEPMAINFYTPPPRRPLMVAALTLRMETAKSKPRDI